MSRFPSLVLALACAYTCIAYAQQPAPPAAAPGGQSAAPVPPMAPPPDQPAKPPAPDPDKVPMNEAVITLKGACQTKPGAAPAEGCITSLTREQFEKLTNALQPPERGPVPPEVRRRFATQYAKLLTFADAARELGLENDPRVEQIFAFARTQILAESLNQHYTQEYSHPTDQQIQDYYNQNMKKFMEVTLQRLIIPVQQANADKPKPSDADQKAYAEKIKERWVAGEDPVKLEKEAMEHNGVSTSPPDINVGARRPGSLPEPHEVVFEMKAGEITNVFADPAAFYIYKVVTIKQLPLADVKTQITQTLSRQMFNDKIQAVQSSVTPVLNEAYFGPEPPPMQPGMPGMRPGMPPMPGHGGPPAPPQPAPQSQAPAAPPATPSASK